MCQESIVRISNVQKKFADELRDSKVIKDVRTLGTILALEIEAGETKYDNAIRKSIYSFFLSRNILLRPLGNVIYVLPPYTTTDAELDLIYLALRDFLKVCKLKKPGKYYRAEC